MDNCFATFISLEELYKLSMFFDIKNPTRFDFSRSPYFDFAYINETSGVEGFNYVSFVLK